MERSKSLGDVHNELWDRDAFQSLQKMKTASVLSWLAAISVPYLLIWKYSGEREKKLEDAER